MCVSASVKSIKLRLLALLQIASAITPAKLTALFAAYHAEAVRLRDKHAPHITILLGVEIDWIRASSRDWVEGLLRTYAFDLFVGSVHHVHAIPIDYDAPSYVRARDRAGGTDERLFEAYFDAQFEMVCALKPPVVGHFDLVRLKSDDVDASFQRWPGVWRAVERNLAYIAGYGGLLEVNSAGLRKGLAEPYPKAEICEAFLKGGGRFTLSDDSHGVEQVGTKYGEVLEFVEKAGIQEIYFLERGRPAFDHRFPDVSLSSVGLADLKRHAFGVSRTVNDGPAWNGRL